MPVDIVPLAEHMTSPREAFKAPVPRQTLTRRAREVPSSLHRPVALSPKPRREVQDPLELRLKQLAKLRQPDSTMPHIENGASDDVATTSNAPLGEGSYRVTDFLRAQVERRWSLDLRRGRNTIVMIHIRVAREGSVTEADIVDRARYANDAVWRAIALSARNAVLLSSPLNLPSGYTGGPIDIVLAMNPKDAMR
jgi:outer membrane biosynthesis protein TonB